jgi:Kdo2-lipid IVA lauroyltransferase/acyltransferase
VARLARPRKKKARPLQILEYLGVYGLVLLSRMLPLKAGHRISALVGDLIYYLLPARRKVALDNVRHAFPEAPRERDIRTIARRSCYSFVASLFETMKLRSLLDQPGGSERIRRATDGLDLLLKRAHEIHEESGGCIFVTPHLGNWEFLPFVGVMAGIPLVVVVRPLDNKHLERLLYGFRSGSGQIITPKSNSLFLLQRALRQGKSIGMLPDQRTIRAISVEYFGRKATTTPVPALLALQYRRPIVVVACCRRSQDFQYEGFVSDPIWPQADGTEEAEIPRLTREMNRAMEAIVRRYPEQYLWMHNRWKAYRTNRDLSLQ